MRTDNQREMHSTQSTAGGGDGGVSSLSDIAEVRTPDARQRPNIVYILADEHRHDAMGCADNEVIITPNLDELAREGVRFANTWCQSPICQPSRASIITGRYPHDVGVVQNFQADFDPAWPTMMKSLQKAGYTTANVGKTHYFSSHELIADGPPVDTVNFASDIASFGFDYVLEEFDRHVHTNPRIETPYMTFLRDMDLLDQYLETIRSVMPFTEHHWDGITSSLPQGFEHSSYLTDQALHWVDQTDRFTPFFLQLSYVQPHSPLIGDAKWAAYYADADVPFGPRDLAVGTAPVWEHHLANLRGRSRPHLLNDDYLRRGIREYYAMISLVDEGIGKLVARLRERGQLDNTWIVYSADHGEMLGDHGLMAKANFYRSSVQVPAIVRPPAQTAASGSVEYGLTESVDLTATILEAGRAEPLPGARGHSLLLRVQEGSQPAARQFNFSEIGADANDQALFWAVTDGQQRLTIERNTSTICEAFDLDSDPEELYNLAGSERGEEIKREFEQYLDAVAHPAL